jgi:hypothetical protein
MVLAPTTGKRKESMKLRLVVPALALAMALPLLAQAQAPGRHPAYLHALTDLHDARWYLEHRPDGPMEERERRAIGEIDRAIEEVQRAAYYDGRNVYEHPREDTYPDAAGRLRRVSELLRKARDDVAQPEDNLQVRDLQYRAVERIDSAIRITESIMVDRERRNYDRP